VVERDAVMVAWQRGLRAYRVADPAGMVSAPAGPWESCGSGRAVRG